MLSLPVYVTAMLRSKGRSQCKRASKQATTTTIEATNEKERNSMVAATKGTYDGRIRDGTKLLATKHVHELKELSHSS